MDDGNSWIGMLLFLGTAALYFILYGFGAAVQAVNANVLEDERDAGSKKAERLLHIQENPYYFIRTSQAVTCLLSMALGAFFLAHVVRRCLSMLTLFPGLPAMAAVGISYIVTLLLASFVLTCLGVVIPKRIAKKSPARFCYKVLPVVDILMKLMFPFTWLIESVAYVVLKLMGIDIHAKDDSVTEEDIMYMVNEGHEQGVLEASEAEMITNIFEFDDKVAADIMTHRKNVIALNGEMTLGEAMDFVIRESGNTRFPVYEEDIDNIIGILNMRDMLHVAEGKKTLDVPLCACEGLLRTPHFIPETKNINALLKTMQSQKIHMAIVVDEYGQTAGIVTMEDIVEEIVGNIMDEYDEEEPEIVKKEDNVYELSGMAPLDDVEDALGIEFDEEDKDNFDTLNGLLVSRLGHIPEDDERADVQIGDYRFHIAGVEGKTIQTVVASRQAVSESLKPEENGLPSP
ncbi:MAG: HlyC/CorC family transporter [Lachnospiraceae bacterium]|nr:HlyC/CorC family transporter [Lachnospiraceae bacterium]